MILHNSIDICLNKDAKFALNLLNFFVSFKVFWLIPPTESNLKSYEQWTLSGKQSNVFFGDLVDKCGRVKVERGWLP